ncbi:MAG: 2-C-methyl-D-erythritol 4-phosphate cytidylyltransferase [Veillonellales bacterium]
MKVTAVIAAAGQGRRMGGGINKIFIPLFDCPILVHSVRMFSHCPAVDSLVIVSAAGEAAQVEELLRNLTDVKPWQVVEGGSERQYSIARALTAIETETDIIVIHDGARPLVEAPAIEQVIATARQYRAAGIAVPVKDTIKSVNEAGFITETPERKALWAMQTPQAFEAGLLRQAYLEADRRQYLGTDDAGLVERLGIPVKIVAGSYRNIKITTPEDLIIAQALMKQGEKQDMLRMGMGYDVHCLVEGRKLILGGVDIPYRKGLEGHSDADVLLHAVQDALLGAAALGDIGCHFPDSDPRYKGVSSLLLLERVKLIIKNHGYRAHNIDATIVAEKPKLAGYIETMNRNIAVALDIGIQQVNVKATTTEGLGFAGRGEGIAAYAVATLLPQK